MMTVYYVFAMQLDKHTRWRTLAGTAEMFLTMPWINIRCCLEFAALGGLSKARWVSVGKYGWNYVSAGDRVNTGGLAARGTAALAFTFVDVTRRISNSLSGSAPWEALLILSSRFLKAPKHPNHMASERKEKEMLCSDFRDLTKKDGILLWPNLKQWFFFKVLLACLWISLNCIVSGF